MLPFHVFENLYSNDCLVFFFFSVSVFQVSVLSVSLFIMYNHCYFKLN